MCFNFINNKPICFNNLILSQVGFFVLSYIYLYMKYTITKDQYRRVLLKYLNSFVGDLVVRPKEKGRAYRYVETSNKDEFANLWHSGPITKGCKKELSLSNVFIDDYESFIPINRKKVFSEVVLEYFILKTGIKCDCVDSILLIIKVCIKGILLIVIEFYDLSVLMLSSIFFQVVLFPRLKP